MKNDLIADILADMKVELKDEFDQNFNRRGFFNEAKWPRRVDGSEATLQQSGKLRRSISGRVSGYSVIFSSSMPYAMIHNQGGKIEVTAKMRKFLWAMFYKNGKRGPKAETYRALALKPIGSYIVIPKRQFIGQSPHVDQIVMNVVKENVDRYMAETAGKFKQKQK